MVASRALLQFSARYLSGPTLRGLVRNVGDVNSAALAAGTALASMGVAGLAAAVNAEKGLREVNTLLGLGSQGFQQLTQDTLTFSSEVGRTSRDVIPALYQSISAGIPRENVFGFLETASDLARAGVTDLRASTDLLTTATNAYANSNLTANRAADVFFAAVRRGKTTIDEIANSAFNLLPTASNMSVAFEEATAAMTALTLQGVPTSVAMTQIRALITALGAPTIRAANAARELGFELGTERLAAEGLLPVLQSLITATGGNDEVTRRLLGSQEALQAAFVLTGDGGKSYRDILNDVTDSQGEAARAAEEMEQSVGVQLEMALADLETQLTALAIDLLPAFNSALGWVTDNSGAVIGAIAALGAAWVAYKVAVGGAAIATAFATGGISAISGGAAAAAIAAALGIAFAFSYSGGGTGRRERQIGVEEERATDDIAAFAIRINALQAELDQGVSDVRAERLRDDIAYYQSEIEHRRGRLRELNIERGNLNRDLDAAAASATGFEAAARAAGGTGSQTTQALTDAQKYGLLRRNFELGRITLDEFLAASAGLREAPRLTANQQIVQGLGLDISDPNAFLHAVATGRTPPPAGARGEQEVTTTDPRTHAAIDAAERVLRSILGEQERADNELIRIQERDLLPEQRAVNETLRDIADLDARIAAATTVEERIALEQLRETKRQVLLTEHMDARDAERQERERAAEERRRAAEAAREEALSEAQRFAERAEDPTQAILERLVRVGERGGTEAQQRLREILEREAERGAVFNERGEIIGYRQGSEGRQARDVAPAIEEFETLRRAYHDGLITWAQFTGAFAEGLTGDASRDGVVDGVPVAPPGTAPGVPAGDGTTPPSTAVTAPAQALTSGQAVTLLTEIRNTIRTLAPRAYFVENADVEELRVALGIPAITRRLDGVEDVIHEQQRLARPEASGA